MKTMAEHLSDQLITAYREGAATPLELLEADDHLAACAACRERVASGAVPSGLGALRAALAADGPPEHLSFESLAGYLDGDLGPIDRELAGAHLELCESCTSELADLRAFRAEMTTHAAAEHRPAARSGGGLRGWLAHPFVAIPLPALGAGAAAAALVFFLGVVPLRERLAAETARGAELARLRHDLDRRLTQMPELEARVETARQEARRAAEEARRLREEKEALLKSRPSGPGLPSVGRLALSDGPGGLAVDPEGHVVRTERLPAVVGEAVRRETLPRPVEMAAVIGLGGYVRGADEPAFAVEGPAGTAVESDRPTLRWRPLEGATGYRVALFTAAGDPVAESPVVTETRWTPAAPLKRGAVYQWEVVAYRGAQDLGKAPQPPAPDARFRVLDAAQLAEIREARRTQAGSHLALGVLYTRAGLFDAAERELEALAKANPESPLARKLLEQLRSLRLGEPQ